MRRERDATLHSIVIWPFVEALRKLGVELPELPELLVVVSRELPGLDAPEPERLTHERASLLLDWAIAFTGRQDIGVLAAEAVEPGHFELVELAARAQRTIGEGLTTIASLVPILHDGLTVKLAPAPGTSSLRIALRRGLSLHPAGYDFIVASLIIGGRRQTRIPDLCPLRVRLPYAARPGSAPHPLARVIDCPIEHGADAIELELETARLDVPLIRADVAMGHALRQAAREMLAKDDTPTALEAVVRERVREGLARDAVDAATLARALHMSERTLRRKLDAEGIGLRALIDDVRRARALELLSDATLSTEALAAQLGFTTAQAFHRAFRRWTGTTIQSYRARL